MSETDSLQINRLEAGVTLPSREHTPDNAELFFYNAALWNAHRIHYDLPYAQNEEGYDGLVIAGPQIGDWMTQVIDDLIAGATDSADFMLAELSYSNRIAAYIGETLTAGGVVTAVEHSDSSAPSVKAIQRIDVKLFVKNQKAEIITPGTAVIQRVSP